jgi:hypothetical protein
MTNPQAKVTFTVRPIRDGFAVFGPGQTLASRVFERREDAVTEAEAFAGPDGMVLIEDAMGHVVGEHI